MEKSDAPEDLEEERALLVMDGGRASMRRMI